MPSPKLPRSLSFALAVVVAVSAACSSSTGGSSPTSPSNGTSSSARIFVGALSVEAAPGLGGIVELSIAPTASSLPGVLSTALSATAAVPATGTLTTNSDNVVNLSGTYDSGTFAMTGGGYTFTASVSGTTLAGAGTAPTGQAASLAGAGGASTTLTPATYVGNYFVWPIVWFDNPAELLHCWNQIRLSGTLTIKVSGTPSKITAEIEDIFTETHFANGGCPFNYPNGAPLTIVADDYVGDPKKITFAGMDKGTNINRTITFTGVAIDDKTLIGTIGKGMVEHGTGPQGQHLTSNYQRLATTVTLTKK